MLAFAIAIIVAYLLGAASPAIAVARLWRGIDIREHGSGNAGATNVARVVGWGPGILVLFLDAAKGFLPVWAIGLVEPSAFSWGGEWAAPLAGIAAAAGHVWPVFYGFRGGKAVATAAGAALALDPVPLAVCLAIFAVIVVASRLVSLASVLAVVSFPIVLAVFRASTGHAVSPAMWVFAVALAVLVPFTHRSNLASLLVGKEDRIGRR